MLIELGSHYAYSMVVPYHAQLSPGMRSRSNQSVSRCRNHIRVWYLHTSKSTNWFRFHHPDLIEERPTVEVLALPTVTVISASCLLHHNKQPAGGVESSNANKVRCFEGQAVIVKKK